ncbi:NB-ARC domain-containing protein [Streptomyces kunmingensis]|uniref:NB-ARC domain-containing protein n=1 Tax=Streptomyces kunmingensis TaxID=68225 RepID=A0ABU6CC39_9ACTN|nr:NB-ARC domain-containing protein [Streptomyces kunmingensis]MEB3962029.1 NB-ARC domain-containing protein [Streptomyces kunmingensis]
MKGRQLPAAWDVPSPAPVSLGDLPDDARQLAVALATAVRVEPELIRAVRVRVRPTVNVGAEAGLWFGPWSAHRGSQYMVLRKPVLLEARKALVRELRASRPEDPIRLAGQIIDEAHEGRSPVLALEERVTWAALLHEAGAADAPHSDVDELLQSFLRTAVEEPQRRSGLRQWFAQAWSRFPEHVRQTSTGLDLAELLGGPGSRQFIHGVLDPSVPDDVADVVLPVRHDGSTLAFGDSCWPADGILVPDTQPRIVHVASDLDAWGEAQEVRVPRGSFTACPVTTVPMYVRTARGQVYRVGAPGGAEGIIRPPVGHRVNSRLLGRRINELTDDDARYFGIPTRAGTPSPAAPVGGGLAAYQPRRVDTELRRKIANTQYQSRILLVRGKPHSGRTRTLWEAMRQELAEWWAWAPALIDRNGCVLKALADDDIGSHTVVWLDDLDESLVASEGEALAEGLLELLDDPGRQPVAVLGTVQENSQLLSRMRGAATSLLRHAETVHIGRGQGWPHPGLRPRAYPVSVQGPTEPVPVVVGRHSERQRVRHALRPSSETSVVAITGAAGVGKSVLAARAARDARALGWFPGGLLVVPLKGEDSVWTALARRLGLTDEVGEAYAQAWCSAQLALLGGPERRVLLLLDDASRAQIAAVRAVLPPGCASVATTRRAHADEGLDVVDLGSLSQADATALLEAFLWQRNPEDARVEQDSAATTGVVKLCGGFPLALATAATWLAADPRRTMKQLLVVLEFESALGLEHHGELPVRHALDVTFHGALPAQQKALCFLTLLPGPEFATTTAEVALQRGARTAALLEELAQRHLIAPTDDPDRWQVPALLRVYGQAVMSSHLSGREIGRTRARIMAYYQERATSAERVVGAEQEGAGRGRTALEWMRTELNNVVAMARWCFTNDAPEAGAAMAMNAARFLFQDHQHAVLMELMEKAERWADRHGQAALRAGALGNIAIAFAARGDLPRARETLAFIAHISRSHTGAQELQMVTNLGAVLINAQQPHEAVELLSDAVAQNLNGSPAAMVLLQCNLSTALLQAGSTDRAFATLRTAEELAERHPLPPEEQGPLFRSLADALKTTGHLDRAVGCLETSLKAYAVVGNLPVQALLHQDLASLYLRARQPAAAVPHLEQAVRLFHKLANPAAEADASQALAETFRILDLHNKALHWFTSARELHQRNNNEELAAQALRTIGVLLLQTGRPAESIPALRNASAHLEALGVQHGQARALRSLAQACLSEDNVLGAHAALLRCAELYSQLAAEQAYPDPQASTDQGSGDLAERAHVENALRDETRALIADLLSVSHRLELFGHVDDARQALSAVELLGQRSGA